MVQQIGEGAAAASGVEFAGVEGEPGAALQPQGYLPLHLQGAVSRKRGEVEKPGLL